MTLAASTASARSPSQGRFAPGEVIAGRYQVIDLLGTGGMGEVYRANDLTLQQPVALKFLPALVAEAPPSLARFRNEVRLARQVSHPNVCRVYDIGTAGDQTFLSMEYVDGEDLASLLRRIGRVSRRTRGSTSPEDCARGWRPPTSVGSCTAISNRQT